MVVNEILFQIVILTDSLEINFGLVDIIVLPTYILRLFISYIFLFVKFGITNKS